MKVKNINLFVITVAFVIGLVAALIPSISFGSTSDGQQNNESSTVINENANGWVEEAEGTRFYVEGVPATGWVVDAGYKNYGLQRYFFDEDGYLVKSKSISDSQAGYWAYARPEGYVVRGLYDNGAGRVFMADNDGKLPDNTGWLVTDDFTGGGLQRYYINENDHGANTAFFFVGENKYWGEGGVGYVLRGNGTRQGQRVSANNEGQLLQNGWLCTADYGQGFQRYWFVNYTVPAENYYATGGSDYTYVTAAGYVLRGTYDNGAGRVFLGNNDGKLASTPGWLVTSEYTGNGLQRYYIDDTVPAAISSLFKVGSNYYYGLGGVGYELRGVMDNGAGHVFLANNDGILESNGGWLVTSAYSGNGLQRYYIDPSYPAAKSSFYTVDGCNYYGQGGVGYVLRGKMRYGSGLLLADNDGKLESSEGWLVTDKYDGHLERYRLDACCNGYVGAHCGKFSLDNHLYYGREDTGYVYRNTNLQIDGIAYYADNDGILQRVGFPGADKMLAMCDNYSSTTGYLLMVDLQSHKLGVFSGKQGSWKINYAWDCSTGAVTTPTATGVFTLENRGYTGGEDCSYYYWTSFLGTCSIHSTLYKQGTFDDLDNRLGLSITNGDVWVSLQNAQWIYNNVPTDTTFVVFN